MAKGPRNLPSAQQLMLRWNLTQKEAEFTVLFLQGLDISECAKQLTMTSETGRWYCKRVMEKLGVNRQAELAIKLLMEFFPE